MTQILGLPPLTRGIRCAYNWKDPLSGITPAYAGNTITRLESVGLITGLPPLTRGILILVRNLNVNVGITPAYAGNTLIEFK